MKIDIIIPFHIVDYETDEMTQKCLNSFRKFCSPEDRFILIDDSSPYNHGVVSTHRNKKRQGNARVWNQGLSYSTADYILISDNDIEATDWRESMLKKAYDPKTGVVFTHLLVGDKIKKVHVDGCFFMVRRDVFDAVGTFDEGFGSYFEDTDFFKRVMNKGYKLRMASDVLTIHKSKGTMNKIMSAEEQKELVDKNQKTYESRYGANYPYISWL